MLFAILLLVMTLSSCNGGWSVAGVGISPEDSLYTDFIVITDQDSSVHWYERMTIDGGILVGENYCYRHNNWEDVRKKNSE